MVAHGESIRKLQPADLFAMRLEEEKPMPCFAMVAVMNQGKTNQYGRIEYGAVVRHKDARLCGFGAMALYSFHSWQLEDEESSVFNQRRDWYDTYAIKGAVKDKEIAYRTQARGYRDILKKCGIKAYKVAHIGRATGARMIEAGGGDETQVRRAGRWNGDKMQGCYLTTLPRKAIRVLFGHPVEGGTFWLARDALEPPKIAAADIPYRRRVAAENRKWGHSRTRSGRSSFLRLLQHMRIVLLQDSVVLKNLYPGLGVWTHPVFASDEYSRFYEQLQHTLATADDPVAIRIEAVMLDMVRAVNSGFGSLNAKIDDVKALFDQQMTTLLAEVRGAKPKRIVVRVEDADSGQLHPCGQHEKESAPPAISQTIHLEQ